MRKLVYGALALSAAMAVAFGVSTDASAADNPKLSDPVTWSVVLSGDDLTITGQHVNAQDNNEVYAVQKILVGVPTLAVKDLGNGAEGAAQNDVQATVKAWDFYGSPKTENQKGTITVDISKYAVTKDNYLMVKADYQKDSEAILIKIPASVTLPTVAYGYRAAGEGVTEAGLIKVYSGKNATKAPYTADNLEFYTNIGSDATYDLGIGSDDATAKERVFTQEDLLNKFSYTGATIYVRDKGSSLAAAEPTDAEIPSLANLKVKKTDKTATEFKKVYVGKKGASTQVKAVVVSQRRGAGKKVTVTKRVAAPAITVNYTTGKITIPKGEYAYSFGGQGNDDVFPAAATTTKKAATTFTVGTTKIGEGESAKVFGPTKPFWVEAYKAGGTKAVNTAHVALPAWVTTDATKVDAALAFVGGQYQLFASTTDAENTYSLVLTDTKKKTTKPATLTSAAFTPVKAKTKLTKALVNGTASGNIKLAVTLVGDADAAKWIGDKKEIAKDDLVAYTITVPEGVKVEGAKSYIIGEETDSNKPILAAKKGTELTITSSKAITVNDEAVEAEEDGTTYKFTVGTSEVEIKTVESTDPGAGE